MAIKMRNNTSMDSVCCECGDPRNKVLDMFDVCIGGQIFTICDECNEALLNKTLRAECAKNARVKTPQDRKVMMLRAQRKSPSAYKAKWQLENTNFNGEKK